MRCTLKIKFLKIKDLLCMLKAAAMSTIVLSVKNSLLSLVAEHVDPILAWETLQNTYKQGGYFSNKSAKFAEFATKMRQMFWKLHWLNFKILGVGIWIPVALFMLLDKKMMFRMKRQQSIVLSLQLVERGIVELENEKLYYKQTLVK